MEQMTNGGETLSESQLCPLMSEWWSRQKQPQNGIPWVTKAVSLFTFFWKAQTLSRWPYLIFVTGKICHVENFFHRTDFHVEKYLKIVNMETNLFDRRIFPREKCGHKSFVTIYAVYLQNLLCYDLRCFVAKSVLSRNTRFCVEKSWNQKLCLWRKKDKY